MTLQLLDRLDQWKSRFGSGKSVELEKLLVIVRKLRLPDAASLIRLHETLLFLRAYPRRMLIRPIEQRIEPLSCSSPASMPASYIWAIGHSIHLPMMGSPYRRLQRSLLPPITTPRGHTKQAIGSRPARRRCLARSSPAGNPADGAHDPDETNTGRRRAGERGCD